MNSPRKWEISRRSASPETSAHPWPASSHKRLDSPKPHWLNIPRPDSPKQHWAPKAENAKNWMSINLPKIPPSQKNWSTSNQRKSDSDIIPDWNPPIQRNSESGSWLSGSSCKASESSKIWLSPNHKRPNSPSWVSPNHKRSDSPKNWPPGNRQRSESPDKNSCSEKESKVLEDAISWPRSKNGAESKPRKTNEEEEEEEENKEFRPSASPLKSWSSAAAIPFKIKDTTDSPSSAKHFWTLPPENAFESKLLWNENTDIKREANTPTFIKTPIWPK